MQRLVLATMLVLLATSTAQGQRLRKEQIPVPTVYTDEIKSWTVPLSFSTPVTPTANGQVGWDGNRFLFQQAGSFVLLGAFSGDLNDAPAHVLQNSGATGDGAVVIQDDDGLSIRAADGLEAGRFRVLRALTTNATPREMSIDGVGRFLTLAAGTSHGYRIELVARGIAGTGAGKTAFMTVRAGARNNAGTTALVQDPWTEIVSRETAGWGVAVAADDPGDRLTVTVTGDAGTTIQWIGLVTDVQVHD